jgi:hypothetical protein
VVEVLDPAGKSLAKGTANGRTDPVLTVQPASDGDLTVRVRDRFRSRGGPALAYRLRVTPAAPDYRLTLGSDALALPRKGSVKLRLLLERMGGFNEPVVIKVEGLPDTVTAAPLTFNPGQTSADLTFQAGPTSPIGVSRVKVLGSAKLAGNPVTRTASLAVGPGETMVDTVLVGVALTAPFKLVGAYDLRLAPRGTVFVKHYRIERNGYTGPLEIRIADRQARHLQGVTGPVMTVPAGANEFDYPVTLPPWMETGRTSRACVMATGVLEEGGVRHTVTYTSPAQNDQIIAVVETGRLGLELGKTSVAGVPGSTVEVPVEIRRARGLTGAVQVELVVPAHMRGVSALPSTIPAEGVAGTLRLRFASPAGPFNGPVVVRATMNEPSGPVTAEAHLEVVAPE